MFIHVHNNILEIKPDGVDNWLVSTQRSSSPARVNDAGLTFFIQRHTAPQDPHAKFRCVRDYPWQCPYMKNDGGYCPCTGKSANDREHLASLELTNYERRQEPIGQMSLFEPTKTHRGYWYNAKSGERVEGDGERPYSIVDVVCKPFAVASMEYLKRRLGFEALKWRILPMDDDMRWVNDQQVKHSGRFSACVFDIWD